MLLPVNHALKFYILIFSEPVSCDVVGLGFPCTVAPPASVSQVAGVVDAHHHVCFQLSVSHEDV